MKVTIIGEICKDVFIYGNTKRLCPEAPVAILQPFNNVTNNGMIGNVYNNLKNLDKNISIESINQKEEIIKTRYIDDKSNHMLLRVDQEDSNVKNIELTNEILNSVKTSNFIIVSDYNKGFLSDDNLIQIGKTSELSILDTKRKLTKKIIEAYTFIKVNEDEYNLNKKLIDNNNSNVIITLGSKGCKFQDKIYKINEIKTIDVSGAGDTFTTAFIYKYYKTNDIEQSLQFANYCAGKVVQKKGVSVPF